MPIKWCLRRLIQAWSIECEQHLETEELLESCCNFLDVTIRTHFYQELFQSPPDKYFCLIWLLCILIHPTIEEFLFFFFFFQIPACATRVYKASVKKVQKVRCIFIKPFWIMHSLIQTYVCSRNTYFLPPMCLTLQKQEQIKEHDIWVQEVYELDPVEENLYGKNKSTKWMGVTEGKRGRGWTWETSDTKRESVGFRKYPW